MAYNPNFGYPPSTTPGYSVPPYPVPVNNAGPGFQPMGFMDPPPQQPQHPPYGYSYPPIPVPVTAPIDQQPTAGSFYPLVPTSGGYISSQTVPLNVPPGLEYLTGLDQLIVKQKVELLEAFLGCETKNKYKVKDSQGRDLFSAKEDTDCCTRNCCGRFRPFDINIRDSNDREVIHLSRPLACDSCLCPCWLQSMEVFSPPGQLCGTVEQEWSICVPKYVVRNAAGEVVLRIEGPFCTFSFCGDVEFQILSRDGGTKVGKISKKWSGLLREAFTDADNFGIQFPMDLDVKMKAVMLGACFLIDFMFFEKSRNREQDAPGMF